MTNDTFDEFDNYRKEQKAEMTLEEKLKEKSIPLMQKYMWIDQPTEMQKEQVILLKDALTICQEAVYEACKKAKIEECEYWREIIFSPEQQAIKPTISLTDFQLRIVELSPKESEKWLK